MRQRNKTNNAGELAQKLAKGGVSQENIDWLIPYLDMTQPERPELLDRAVRQSLNTTSGGSGAGYSLYLLVDLLKGRDQEFSDRVVKAFFRVSGPYWLNAAILQSDRRSDFWDRWLNASSSQADRQAAGFWGQVSQGELSLDELLGPGGKGAMLAGRWMSSGQNSGDALRQLSAEELEAALARVSGTGDLVLPVLQCLRLAQRGKPSGGLLSGLLSGGRDGTEEAVRAVQEAVIALLPQAGLDPHSPGMPKLIDYIRQGKNVPLPVRLQRPTPYMAMNVLGSVGSVGGACFLALEAAPALRPAYVVCAAITPGAVLARSLSLAGVDRFRAEVPWLVENTPFSSVLVYLHNNEPELSKELVGRYPGLYESSFRKAGLNESELLLKIIRDADPERASRLHISNRASVQGKAIQFLTELADPSLRSAVPDFLQRGKRLDRLLARYSIGGGTSWSSYGSAIEGYVRDYKTDPFSVRCLILVSMLEISWHVSSLWNHVLAGLPGEPRTAGRILDMALQEGLSPMDCLKLVEATDKGAFTTEQKVQGQETAQWLLEQPEEVLAQALTQGSACIRGIAVQTLALKGDLEAILPLAGDSSKQVRAQVTAVLAACPGDEGLKAVTQLLSFRKAAQRETALDILDQLGKEAAETLRPQLEGALEREKSAKLAARLRALLGLGQTGLEAEAASGDLVKETLKGGKKRKVQWVLEGTQQLVSRSGGGALADEDQLAALLVSCTQPGGVDTAKALARSLEPRELTAFAQTVYDLWMEQGAPSKQKWVLTFAALFGGRDMVDTLKRQIAQWPQEARGAIACDAVTALALSPEPEGLLTVDSISRKFKFKQVKAAAGRALDFAAKELGLTADELADRIVPDLGLDARGSRTFDYGPRSFTVTLTPALTLEVKTQEGKTLKTLPAPGKQDDPALAGEASAQFKALKKQIKSTVTTQTLRLEQALSTGRTWTGQGWRELFVQKPVMRQFAVGLVWGVYEEGVLSAAFRYLEDGSLNTADEEEYELSDQAQVGLIHPVELSEEDLELWKNQLEDYEITQPFPQLARSVARLEAGTEKNTSLETFGGRVLNGLSLSGKLLSQGWFRGSAEDAGIFYYFYREDGPIGVRLNFSGAYAGGEDSDVVLYDLEFYRVGANQWDRSGLVPLGQVPPRLYSEAVYQLQRASASSTEVQKDWKQKR